MNNLIIKNAAQVVTCSGFEGKRGAAMSNLNVIENGTVIVTDGIISHVLKQGESIPENLSEYEEIDATGNALLLKMNFTFLQSNGLMICSSWALPL